MSLQAKTYLNLLAGAFAGFLAWVLTDLTGWFSDVFQPNHVLRLGLFSNFKFLLYGIIFGLLLGLFLALVDSLSLETRRRQLQALAVGAVSGAAAGWIGLGVGQVVYGLLYNSTGLQPDEAPHNPGQFVVLLIARALGYALIGGIVGAAQGIVSRSQVIARQGAFGGFLGGFLGGTVFQILSGLDFPSSLSRLLALAATGALAGFFVGLVQNLLKQAWIRVVLGRNEGKEYLIAKPVTTIGRSELADIGLFGDPSIAPTHAAIESLPAQNRHRLRAVMETNKRGSAEYMPPLVNGQPVAGEQWLADGDTLQIGRRTLLFFEKATRKGAVSAAPVPVTASNARPASRYVGEELSAPPLGHSSLTTPADVVAQMGAAPVEAAPAQQATVLTGPGFGGLGSRLVAIQGPYSGQSFLLSHTTASIGRATERDIALSADTSISRTHARISYAEGRHFIADDGSSNGTFVNGGRVGEPRLLSSGDTIQLAETVFRYE